MTQINANYIELVAFSTQIEGQESYRLVSFLNVNKKENNYLLIPASILATPNKIKMFLLWNGFNPKYIQEKPKEILDVIVGECDERIVLCNKPGFFYIDNDLYYIKSSGKVLGKNSNLKLFPYPNARTFNYSCLPKGSLKKWKNKVAITAKHSPYIMTALCSALAGMCIFFTKIESGGLHLYGKSSTGKSTVLKAAASVFGDSSYILDWNLTEAAFEQQAESRNHGLLLTDELILIDSNRQAAAQKMQKFAYMLGSGTGKTRSGNYQERTATWQLVALSNGEEALSQHASAGLMDRKDGERARFVDVPVNCDNDMGIFWSLPNGIRSSSEYAESLKENCNNYYGTAGDAFLSKVLAKVSKKSSKYVSNMLERYITEFLEKHDVCSNGLEKRIATRFALIYASGILGIKTNVLPFTKKEVFDGVSHCYLKSIEQNPVKRPILNQKLVDALLSPSRPQVSLIDEEKLNQLNVVKISVNKVPCLSVRKEFFDANIIGNKKIVIKQLISEEKLITDAQGKSTRQCKVNGVKLSRRYCLKVDVVS
ncbi:DUF927 domain-containing protein [Providencia rettgeri]